MKILLLLFLFLNLPLISSSAASSSNENDDTDSVFVPIENNDADSIFVPIENISDSVIIETDTLLYQPVGLFDNISSVSDSSNFEFKMSQNPSKALFKSMAVPGWGQFGNKRKVKGAIFFAFDVWMVASAIHYGGQARDFKTEFDNTPDSLITKRREIYDLYSDRRDNRNKFTWYAVIVSFVSMFDAYVDAHLSGYPKADEPKKISFDIVPDTNNSTMVKLSYSF